MTKHTSIISSGMKIRTEDTELGISPAQEHGKAVLANLGVELTQQTKGDIGKCRQTGFCHRISLTLPVMLI